VKRPKIKFTNSSLTIATDNYFLAFFRQNSGVLAAYNRGLLFRTLWAIRGTKQLQEIITPNGSTWSSQHKPSP